MIDTATLASIMESLGSWDRTAAAKRETESEQCRQGFIERFPIESWPQLRLEDYALGQNGQETVSWWMEYKPGLTPSMKGGSASKHLIFLDKGGSWRFPQEYESVDRAWSAIRDGFVEMLSLAKDGQFEDADDIRVLTGAPALRTKLLCVYFPEELVPVSSKADIDHYLRALGETVPPSVVRSNRQLLRALRAVPPLASLNNQELGRFLYHWNNPRPSQRVVKIAPGERGTFWDDCLQNGFICVGWDEVGDLTQYENKDEFRASFREHFPYNGVEQQVSRKANELWTLLELQPGDTVLANRGTTELLGVGTVNATGYVWHPEREQYKHTVGVDWDTSAAKPIDPVRAWATTTVSKVPATLLRQILGATTTAKPVDTDQTYLDLEAALQRRGQAVLYGPPGTGKTYLADRAAVWLLEGGSASQYANTMLGDASLLATRRRALAEAPSNKRGAARLTRITFHPSYAYEDFIEGFRPVQSESGTLQLMLKDGAFKRVCDAASADPENRYVVLIDELNRGNVPKIFGELITLIEKDKRGFTVQLSQSGASFSVPPNVLIIGTMNTADRSIHLLDTALRRRFQFLELLPDSDVLEGTTVGALALDAFLDGINEEIRKRFGRDKQVGHSLFFQDGQIIDTPEDFAAMFRYELLPLLQEYLFEDYRALSELLGKVIDVEGQRVSDLASEPEALCAELAGRYGSASA
ncbi:McrB family protein [Mycolicibacterium sp. P1-5]|uniref:McrB family protein n=1 Tax=Mycolicibacterium sp. P1-5 TaxID=2024617 RepID=UPI0011F03C27|nr:AAA family ATPase [Mycolicibacterium sp. P1-5]KAA0110613.1 restriction endonuclease [Mycolicibacterium sp. P1-5]